MGLAKINVGGTWKNIQRSSSTTTTCSCSGGCTNGCNTACQSTCGGGAKMTVIRHVKARACRAMVIVILVALMHALRRAGTIAPVVEDALTHVRGAVDGARVHVSDALEIVTAVLQQMPGVSAGVVAIV